MIFNIVTTAKIDQFQANRMETGSVLTVSIINKFNEVFSDNSNTVNRCDRESG
jgi:hypothetical protein